MKTVYNKKQLFGAFDLHSNNNHLAIIDGEDNRIYRRKLPNQPDVILAELEPYKGHIAGIVVESTFNWYWLVDLLMDEGYRMHLANPAGIQKYEGLKHSDDNHDAFWLAHLLRLGILPEGYIYPKQEWPVRDLLRKRGHLVRLRTSLINSLQDIIYRNCGTKIGGNNIKAVKENKVAPLLSGQDDLALSGEVSKETIDYLGRQIRKVENSVLDKIKLREEYTKLLSIAGVGKILALTIMLETGAIKRFPKVGDYASYCRKVPSHWTSNSKKKGRSPTNRTIDIVALVRKRITFFLDGEIYLLTRGLLMGDPVLTHGPHMLAKCTGHHCGSQMYIPHPCGHRSCPHCQNHENWQWIENQLEKRLPATYYLITFTLPRQLRDLAWKNQKTIYSLMFSCVQDVLKTFAEKDKKLLGSAGFTTILHTHARNLEYHPHIHVVMPGASINTKTGLWRVKSSKYLFHHKSLAKVFRAKLLQAIVDHNLRVPPDTPKEWVADCKEVGSGDKAIIYLGKYL